VFHHGPALFAVVVAVGGEHLLVDTPGRLDLDVLIPGEQGLDPGPLPVGEQVNARVQGPPRPVERIAGAAAVTVQGSSQY